MLKARTPFHGVDMLRELDPAPLAGTKRPRGHRGSRADALAAATAAGKKRARTEESEESVVIAA